MVQVDVIWSYAFGASFAAASARDLYKEEKPFKSDSYSKLLHFLAIFFAPSGLYLLTQHPSWETMQVAQTIADIPAWLMTLFGITNVTQGIAGYYVGYRLARKGNFYGSHVNWMVSWVLFWFVLICGWDTHGWQRFLYDRDMFHGVAWSVGQHMGPLFLLSTVFHDLAVMGLILAPVLWIGIVTRNYVSIRTDRTIARPDKPCIYKIGVYSLGVMFTVCLWLALAASLIVMGIATLSSNVWLGYALGLPISILIGYYFIFPRDGLMFWFARRLFINEPADSPCPVQKMVPGAVVPTPPSMNI